MSVYLQRLLARAGGALAPAAFGAPTPAAAVTSPLVGYDQRLGLPEFDSVPPEEGAPAEATAATEGEGTAPNAFQPPQPQARPREAALPGTLDAAPPILVEILKEAPPARPDPGGPAPDPSPILPTPEPSFVPPRPFDIAIEDFVPVPPPQPIGVAEPEPEPGPGGESPAATFRIPPRDAEPSPRTETDVAEAGEAARELLPSPVQVREAEPAWPDPHEPPDMVPRSSPAGPEPIPAEPAPQDRPAPTVSEPASPAVPPQVTIEEVVIEVRDPVQPAAAGRGERPSAMPVTAAAASVIGPLPVRRSAITLYGMRRR